MAGGYKEERVWVWGAAGCWETGTLVDAKLCSSDVKGHVVFAVRIITLIYEYLCTNDLYANQLFELQVINAYLNHSHVCANHLYTTSVWFSNSTN